MKVSTRVMASRSGVNGAKDRDTRARDALVGHIGHWMRRHKPGVGVDVLLTRPLDAIRLALHVGAKTDQLDRSETAAVAAMLAELEADHADTVRVIDTVCRAAMCARKRGSLRTINRK